MTLLKKINNRKKSLYDDLDIDDTAVKVEHYCKNGCGRIVASEDTLCHICAQEFYTEHDADCYDN